MRISSFLKRRLQFLLPPQVLWLPRYYIFFKRIKFKRRELILDAACGEGEITISLDRKGLQAIGIDKSTKNITSATNKITGGKEKANFIIADIKQIPFRNETFDKIVSLDTLEHINEDSDVFLEFYRILKPNGRLIATVPYTHCCSVKLYKEQRILRRIIPPFFYTRNLSNAKAWLEADEKDVMKEHGHLRNYSIADLEKKTMHLFGIDHYEYFFKRFSALATDITYGIRRLWNFRFIFFYIAVRLDYFFRNHKKGYWLIVEFIKIK
jgi:ubiquinone/menaquinone biosynthesis C-methylase UbiE